ncbi:metallophosphoesterase [Corallococcus exiguus]|uniref:metallophosphoesterase n=1 Tax=Corallococcus exiguus TaxID=83462 RepID=UPI003DA46E1C
MEKLVLVHLSDIHFTGSSGTVHDLDVNVRNELRRDAASLTRQLGPATGVLVTGDIAFSGKKEEYQYAADWLREFCAAVDCPEQNVSVVPGNHDVDRKLAGDLITKMLHQSIRETEGPATDSKLREFFSNAQSANALLAPLAEYNVFAARYGCSVSAKVPYWQRDLALSCGTVIRMRGLSSAFVSNAEDDKGKMILGTAQAGVPREDGVLYLTLCHHPPEWLRDQDSVEDHLKSKVHIQLFGHKHAQRVDVINEKVRLVAGAMHPERRERDWVPTYNILEISRRDADHINLRLFQRRWHQSETCFVADRNPNNGMEYRDFKWPGFPRRVRVGESVISPPQVTKPETPAVPHVVPTTVVDPEAAPASDSARLLTFRFLTLPSLVRYEIALKLGLLREEDDALPRESLFLEVFKRAVDARLLAKLWTETEQRHNDPAPINPFQNSQPGE